jgi:hypothetical protein
MPLFLRALPLTLKTLPHYILTLPFLVVLVLLFSILALIPLVGLIVPGAITAFCAMIGFRCALAAHGDGNEPNLLGLFGASLLFSVINLLAMLVVVAFALAFTVLSVGVPQDMTSWWDLVEFLDRNDGWIAYLQLVLVSAYAAAMAVPMTTVAEACTPGARRPDALKGFGTGFISLMIVLAVSAIVSEYFGFFAEIWIYLGLLSFWVVMYMVGGELPDLPLPDLGFAVAVLAVIGMSCWFFATAVLAWDATRTRKGKTADIPLPAAHATLDDLRALRESRMPGARTPPDA